MSRDIPSGFAAVPTGGGFGDRTGPIYERRSVDGYACGFRAGPEHGDRDRNVHGGMLHTVLEHAFSVVVRERAAGAPCRPVSLNADYVGDVAMGGWVECRGEVIRETRSLVFVKGELTVDDAVAMTASGIWRKPDGG